MGRRKIKSTGLVVISARIPTDVYQELQIRIPERERSNFIRDAILEKLEKTPKPDRILELEERMKKLEESLFEVKKTLSDFQLLTYEHGKINPHNFCRDDLDHKIIDHLLQQQGATTPELSKALGTDRWTILKRLEKIQERSKKELGIPILAFYAGEKAGKKRAWWIAEGLL